MRQQRETNPHFLRPLQPEPRQDPHSQPTSPLEHDRRFPLHPELRQDPHSQPNSLLVQQPRPHRKRSKRGLEPPQKSNDQLQPTRPRMQDPLSHSPGGLAPHSQQLGQHPQSQGPRLDHYQPHDPPGPRSDHRQQPSLWQPRDQRPTKKAITWFGAVFCAIFWIVIIVGGVIVLIVYLVYRPRSPQFDVSSATLNAAYLDMGYLLNADVTLLANFTNPSKRVSVDFSYMYINLYYGSTLIAEQYIEPFSAARGESRFANVHMVTSQVRLPLGESRRLKKQMESNGVMFEVKSFLRTRSNFGSILRYSYWLHGQCTILLTGPPDGVMIRSKCKTKRWGSMC